MTFKLLKLTSSNYYTITTTFGPTLFIF